MAILFIIIGIIVLSLIGCLCYLCYCVLKSPFKYPYYIIEIDISGRRSPSIEDIVDEYIIANGINRFTSHYESIKNWKADCQNKISKSPLKETRRQQYEKVIDDDRMFIFRLTRLQTRYKQVSYHKQAYKVPVVVKENYCNLDIIKNRYNALAKINFECTVSEYTAKDQRKRMNKQLRDEIAKRDNYTCQRCGKYMPDGVGLHIDHIVPISKGGKSVPSNLQVLCSKCNGSKSDK